MQTENKTTLKLTDTELLQLYEIVLNYVGEDYTRKYDNGNLGLVKLSIEDLDFIRNNLLQILPFEDVTEDKSYDVYATDLFCSVLNNIIQCERKDLDKEDLDKEGFYYKPKFDEVDYNLDDWYKTTQEAIYKIGLENPDEEKMPEENVKEEAELPTTLMLNKNDARVLSELIGGENQQLDILDTEMFTITVTEKRKALIDEIISVNDTNNSPQFHSEESEKLFKVKMSKKHSSILTKLLDDREKFNIKVAEDILKLMAQSKDDVETSTFDFTKLDSNTLYIVELVDVPKPRNRTAAFYNGEFWKIIGTSQKLQNKDVEPIFKVVLD